VTDGLLKGRRTAEEARRTKDAIVAAALDLFAARGYDAVSVRDVAAAAGTTHGLLRHHFASKEGVWRAVVDTADARFAAAMQPVIASATAAEDPAEALATLIRGLVDAARRNPEAVRLLLHEATEDSDRIRHILRAMQPLRGAITSLIDTLHHSGRLRHFDADSMFLLLLLAATAPLALPGLTRAVLGADPLDESYVRQHADRILRTVLGREHEPCGSSRPGGQSLQRL